MRAVAVRGWSPLQTAIFEALHAPETNILIQAVAGSGKTTTLIEGLRHAPGTALFMAFNKSIAEDIRGKAPKGDVKTLNALGHRLWMQNLPASKLDFDKLRNIVKSIMPADEFREWGYHVQRMVSMAKNSALNIDGNIAAVHLHEDFLDIADTNDALPIGKENDAAIYAESKLSTPRSRDEIYLTSTTNSTCPCS